MPATRGQKRQYDDTHYATEPSTQTSKRRKLTIPEPLHHLLKKNGIDTSYGWGIASFYDKEENLQSSDKLIKYEVDTTLKIARYKGKEFPFEYIEYEDDYIISFGGIKINIKNKKDVDNLLDFASPDIEDKKEEPKPKPTPKTDDDETETEAENDDNDDDDDDDNDETETEAENDDDDDESSLIQNQNPIQIQHPNFHHQHQFQHQNPIQYQQENYYQQQMFQQQMFQQQFSIQTMIRTEITTNLIPWMKEYIDSELQKLKQ